MKQMILLILLIFLVGCTSVENSNTPEPADNQDVQDTQEPKAQQITFKSNIMELKDGVVLEVNNIEYKNSVNAKGFTGEVYEMLPKGQEDYQYVIIDVTFKSPVSDFVEFKFRQGQIQDQLRLKTKESESFYDKVCIPNIDNMPKVSCEFTAASVLQMEKGDEFNNKLLFAIPDNETIEKLSYFYYTKESSVSLE